MIACVDGHVDGKIEDKKISNKNKINKSDSHQVKALKQRSIGLNNKTMRTKYCFADEYKRYSKKSSNSLIWIDKLVSYLVKF